MDCIFDILDQRAFMQKELIKDGEQCVPISEVGYYTEMDIDCDNWPAPIAAAIAAECFTATWAFAAANSYHVVTITDRDNYSEVLLFDTLMDAGSAKEILFTLCIPKDLKAKQDLCHDAALNYLLASFLDSHSKIIVL